MRARRCGALRGAEGHTCGEGGGAGRTRRWGGGEVGSERACFTRPVRNCLRQHSTSQSRLAVLVIITGLIKRPGQLAGTTSGRGMPVRSRSTDVGGHVAARGAPCPASDPSDNDLAWPGWEQGGGEREGGGSSDSD